MESMTFDLEGARGEALRIELYAAGLVASLVGGIDLPISLVRRCVCVCVCVLPTGAVHRFAP